MGILGMLRPLLYFSCLLSLIDGGKRYIIKTGNGKSESPRKSQDYGYPGYPGQYTDSSVTKVEEGKDVHLKCNAPDNPGYFDNCKFIDPSGNIHNIGISGGSSYNRARIDCLCTVEEYDPTATCGVLIRNANKQDTGTWSCIIEVNGRDLVKPLELQVGEDPYDNIIGGFVPEPGVTIIKYRKPEEVKSDNLIKVFNSVGSEFQLKFDLYISELKNTKNPYNILTLTADTGTEDVNNIKYGERIPAVFVKDDQLIINSAVNCDPNHEKRFPLTGIGKWIKIEICQHVIDDKLTYEIKINRKSVYKEVQTVPCLYKGVSVFAGKPGSEIGFVKAKIRNLWFSTSDKVNHGRCLVDYRPTPLDPSGKLPIEKKPGTPEGPNCQGNTGNTGPGVTNTPLTGNTEPEYPGIETNTTMTGNTGNTGTGAETSTPMTGNPGAEYPPQTEQCVVNPGELCLKRGQLLQVLDYMGREYIFTFSLYLYSYQPRDQKSSVIHFTTTGDDGNYGDRNPAVSLSGQGNNPDKIVVGSSVNGNVNFHVYSERKYPLKTWIPIKISRQLIDGKFIFKVVIDGEPVLSQVNKLPTEFTNVKVFASDPWYPAANGKIRNVFLNTNKDGVCICKAAAKTCKKVGCLKGHKIYPGNLKCCDKPNEDEQCCHSPGKNDLRCTIPRSKSKSKSKIALEW